MHILVVDDEPLNRFLIIHMLEQEGYDSISEACDGEAALTVAEQVSPDIVLLDIVMPGMSGYEVAPKLKELAGDLYLPVIFITAHGDQHSITKALESGGDDFLAKPFLREVLAAKIRAHARTRTLSKRASESNKVLSYHQNKTEQEHHLVKHIFSNALKIDTELPTNIDFHMAPATHFNGDMIRVERGPGNNLYLLLGDFTGHGLASAIGALPAARVFKEGAVKGWSAAQIVRTLNALLVDMLPETMFFAATVVEISSNGRQLSVWNGGMPDTLLLSPSGEIVYRFTSQHMALGVLQDNEFESYVERYKANKHEQLLLYSDGVIESFNQEGDMLTDKGFESWLADENTQTVPQIIARLSAFRAGAEQMDDVSLMKFECHPLSSVSLPSSLSNTGWNLTFYFGPEQLKGYEPLQPVMNLLHGNSWLAYWMSDISTIMTELFANSLEHGLLKLNSELKQEEDGFYRFSLLREQRLAMLDSGEITLHVDYIASARKIVIRIEDTGCGFDINGVTNRLDTGDFHGRGLALIRELSSKVSVTDNGRRVEVEVMLTA